MVTAALGAGITLAGCGGGAATSGTGGGGIAPPGGVGGLGAATPPNGFKLTEVFSSESLHLPTQNKSQLQGAKTALKSASAATGHLESFTGGVELTNGSHLFFTAVDTNQTVAIYEVDMEYSSGGPRVVATKRLMGVGDTLPDGTVVAGIGRGQANSHGTYCTVVARENAPPTVYVGNSEEGFVPLVEMGDRIPGGGGSLAGDFSNVAIDDEGNVAFVASYTPDGTTQNIQAIFYVKGHDPHHASSGVLFTERDAIPDGLGLTGGIGIIGLSPAGSHFVAQTTINGGAGLQGGSDTGPVSPAARASTPSLPNIAVVQGTVGQASSHKIVAAPKAVALNPLLKSANTVASGTAIYGPRVTCGGVAVNVLHLNEKHLALYYADKLIMRTGDKTPLGNTVVSFSPAGCGDYNRIYFVAICEESAELLMYDGVGSFRTVLARGHKIGGKTVSGINFGLTRNQTDLSDRFVLIAEYDDQTSGIVIGTPV